MQRKLNKDLSVKNGEANAIKVGKIMIKMTGDVLALTLTAVVLTVAGASNYIQGESIKTQAQAIEKLESRIVSLELSNKIRANQENQDKQQRVMSDREITKITSQ